LKASSAEWERRAESAEKALADEVKLAQAKSERWNAELVDTMEKKREAESALKTAQAELEDAGARYEDLGARLEERERTVKEVTTSMQSLRVVQERTQRELDERLEKSVGENEALEDLREALREERLRVDELQVALGEAESERDRLHKAQRDHERLVQAAADLEERNVVLEKDVEDLKRKMSFAQTEFEREREEMNDVVQKSRDLLQRKIEEFRQQKSKHDALLEENGQMSHYKRSVMLLEQEKRELETRLVSLEVEVRRRPMAGTMASSVGDSSGRTDSETTSSATTGDLSDPELRGQVEFLNSVIVDMQRKNDELKAKVDLIESAGIVLDPDIVNGGGVDANDSYLLNGLSSASKAVPPRLFCDICDEFDRHDTEDCPTQAQTLEEEAFHTRSGAARPGAAGAQERPYCETCEMFMCVGDCDDQQTF